MSAIRLARGFTKRDKLIKFDGCYHGHADSLLVKAGSGALTFGHRTAPGAGGVHPAHDRAAFNDSEAVTTAFAANQGQIAGIILEPVPGTRTLFAPARLPGVPAREHASQRLTAHFR